MKTLTEQWREGTLPAGYYYVVDVEGVKDLDDFNGENFSLLDVVEVLAPVPDYMDCKGLMYDSIALDKVRKKVAELSSENGRLQYDNDALSTVNDELLKKVERLEKKLDVATKALKKIDPESVPFEKFKHRGSILRGIAQQALKEMEEV